MITINTKNAGRRKDGEMPMLDTLYRIKINRKYAWIHTVKCRNNTDNPPPKKVEALCDVQNKKPF